MKTPRTNAIPIPIGKAIAIPAISIAITNKRLAKLKMIPPTNADVRLLISACSRSCKKLLPPSPTDPRVNAKNKVINKIPKV